MTFDIGSFIGGVIAGVILVIAYILYAIRNEEDIDDEADWEEE